MRACNNLKKNPPTYNFPWDLLLKDDPNDGCYGDDEVATNAYPHHIDGIMSADKYEIAIISKCWQGSISSQSG